MLITEKICNLPTPANSLSKADQRKQEALFGEEIILAFYTDEEFFSFTLKPFLIKCN